MPKLAVPNRTAAKLGSLFRALRKQRGWTLVELGRAAKMNPTYLGFVERGDNVPSLTVILHLAHVLGAKGWELIKQVEEGG